MIKFLGAIFCLVFCGTPAIALDNIIRPYQSVRTSGMGGVVLTTGLYDQNFFGNPARVTANPEWKIQLLDPMVESNPNTIKSAKDIIAGKDVLQKVAKSAGNNLHSRVQFTFPGVYLPYTKWSYGFAVLTSIQTDLILRRSFQVDPGVVADVGPALTVGRKMLVDDRLSVGITPHLTYRVSTSAGFGLSDLLGGKTLKATESGGQGAHLDFDVGATYKLHMIKPLLGFSFTGAFAANNVLGGYYNNMNLKLIKTLDSSARRQPRSFGVGIGAHRPTLAFFKNAVLALELRDIGNNKNGSAFKWVHMGGEVTYGVLSPRLGINQGYFAAGLGLDVGFFSLDLATYGEELALNTGQFEDRRYSLRLAFQI